MQLSVILPVLNEAERLAQTLSALEPLRARGHEIIVVDGHSDDGSFDIALRAGVYAIRGQRGRARQMNAGAEKANGDTLLFLHADTRLPPDADALIARQLAHRGRCWGRFDVRIAGTSCWFPLIASMINLRSRFTGVATGDQAIFVTKAAFRSVGGFADQPLMEDIALSKRLKSRAAPICIRDHVVTSGRRWERDGVARTILLMWRLRWAYWRGTPVSELAELYQ
jgi:rSAM/selenodomain-associated transferase 2